MSLHLRTLPAGFMVPCLPTSAKRPDLAAAQQFARMTMRQPTQFLEQCLQYLEFIQPRPQRRDELIVIADSCKAARGRQYRTLG